MLSSMIGLVPSATKSVVGVSVLCLRISEVLLIATPPATEGSVVALTFCCHPQLSACCPCCCLMATSSATESATEDVVS